MIDIITGKMYDVPLIPFSMAGADTDIESVEKLTRVVEKNINTVKNLSVYEPHKVLAAVMSAVILARNDN